MTVKRDARGRKRDYKKEYKRDQAGRPAKKNRAARNKARRKALRSGSAKKGDNLESHHSKPYARGRTRLVERSTNRRIGKPG